MKFRTKPINDVIEFKLIDHDGKLEKYKNTNELEISAIISELEQLLLEQNPPTVAIITPFRDQQMLIQRKIATHFPNDEITQKLKLRVFTFDTCQGEERDLIIYSMVATNEKDRLNSIFPRSLEANTDLDSKLREQRLNVGFSRAKEKILIIHSKPIEEFNNSIGSALQHFQNELISGKNNPDDDIYDSPQEKALYQWLTLTRFYRDNKEEITIQPQFNIGRHLKYLDPSYEHPNYVTDFLITKKMGQRQKSILLEYDGYLSHFDTNINVDIENWKIGLSNYDIEREKILESFGYPMLRVNKFNLGEDPVITLNERLNQIGNSN